MHCALDMCDVLLFSIPVDFNSNTALAQCTGNNEICATAAYFRATRVKCVHSSQHSDFVTFLVPREARQGGGRDGRGQVVVVKHLLFSFNAGSMKIN